MATMTACRWRMVVCIAIAIAATPIQIGDRQAGWLPNAHAQDDLPADTNEAANVLFVRALQAIADADTAGTAEARLALLQQAQADLDRILRDYSGSALAVQIISQQRIGIFDPRELVRDIRSAERTVAREVRAAERDTARQAEEAAIEAERERRLAIVEAERDSFCPDHPEPCALLADAMAIVEIMPRDVERVRALSHIASAYAMMGLTEVADLAFADAMRLAEEISGRDWGVSALWPISISQAEAGLFAEALTTVADIDEDRIQAQALSSIAGVFATAGRTDEARTTFGEAVAMASVRPDNPEDGWRWADDLAEIAFGQARSGFSQDARATLALLDGFDVLTADRHGMQVRTMVQIGLAEASAGLSDRARQTFASALSAAFEIEDESSRGFVLRSVVHAQARAGFFEETLSWVAEIAEDGLRAQLLHSIVARQAHAGLFDRALATAGTIPASAERIGALRTIAGAQANAGMLHAALETFVEAEAMAAAGEADSPAGRIWLLARIARAEAAAGHTNDARRRFADATDAAFAIGDQAFSGRYLEHIVEAQAAAAALLFEAG